MKDFIFSPDVSALRDDLTIADANSGAEDDVEDDQAWYWDYDENTWVLCDDDEEWDEYEYIDSEEEAFYNELSRKKHEDMDIAVAEDLGPVEPFESTVVIEKIEVNDLEPNETEDVTKIVKEEISSAPEAENGEGTFSPSIDVIKNTTSLSEVSAVVDPDSTPKEKAENPSNNHHFEVQSEKSSNDNIELEIPKKDVIEIVEPDEEHKRVHEKDEKDKKAELINQIKEISSICMWGHDNCTIKSHFKYDWQMERKNELMKKALDNTKVEAEVTRECLKSTLESKPSKDKEPPAARKISNPTSKKIAIGGAGAKGTLEMLRNRITKAGQPQEDREKIQRNIELDKMKKMRQAGVTKDYSSFASH